MKLPLGVLVTVALLTALVFIGLKGIGVRIGLVKFYSLLAVPCLVLAFYIAIRINGSDLHGLAGWATGIVLLVSLPISALTTAALSKALK